MLRPEPTTTRRWATALATSLVSACAVGADAPPVRRDAGRTDASPSMDAAPSTPDASAPTDSSPIAPRDASASPDATPACPSGTTRCGARCVNLQSDAMNCGECGVACTGLGGAVGSCTAGRCVTSCAMNRGDCNGRLDDGCEQDLSTSVTHCGACGRGCALANATSACNGGRCILNGCASGFSDCNSTAADGCEVDTRSDAANCGGCAIACARPNAAGVCASGACQLGACDAGFGDCDGNAANGCEANLATDPNHCGRCGNRPVESCNLVDDNCNGVCDDGAGCRVAVHRSVNAGSGEHFYTTDMTEAMCCGFRVEHANFYYLYTSAAPGLVALMRCIAPNGMHFYTTDPGCEGTRVEGPMGFLATSPTCGATALFRLVHRSNGDHFYTHSAAERDLAVSSGAYLNEGTTGYVWLSSAGM